MDRVKRILFLGEGALEGPARYLAAVLHAGGFRWDHCPDRTRVPARWLKIPYDAYVFSDYRHAALSRQAEARIRGAVLEGAGLVMIGGWASYTGLIGGYAGSDLERLLPVRCVAGDDRVNWASGSLVQKLQNHSVLRGLDFRHPPMVCGYHRATLAPGAHVLLGLQDVVGSYPRLRLGKSHPLLVVGQAGRGRTASFLTDCAPHWAGGLVDWGRRRRSIRISKDHIVEIGDDYLRFFTHLLNWLSQPT